MFNVDWLSLIQQLLPPLKRKEKRASWLNALVAPLIQLYQQFLLYRLAMQYKLAFNSQIVSLEHLLNDQFNNSAEAYTNDLPTGIYISDPTVVLLPVYLYNDIEQRPALILYNEAEGEPPVYLRNTSEYEGLYDFIVNVPDGCFNVATNLERLSSMKAWINIYRLAGKRYNIVNYTP